MLSWARVSTPRRKLWVAILLLPAIGTVTGAEGVAEALGGLIGISLFYLIPVAIWEFGLSRLFD